MPHLQNLHYLHCSSDSFIADPILPCHVTHPWQQSHSATSILSLVCCFLHRYCLYSVLAPPDPFYAIPW
ncbi:hypothetical protein SK128_022207 [Halocaridina rubra]|uniref:Uncharacterized protein n=1 Tax=Halocaridina rubra TaxID=373956 RepID=A0AAN9AGT1_HALRR